MISIAEQVGDIVRYAIKKIVAWLSENEEIDEEEVVEEDDNKSPPTLGVKVADNVNTRDIFGG